MFLAARVSLCGVVLCFCDLVISYCRQCFPRFPINIPYYLPLVFVGFRLLLGANGIFHKSEKDRTTHKKMQPKLPLNWIRLPSGFGIVQMLALEEALLRFDPNRDNWFVSSDGPLKPTVILGLSGKPENLINISKCLNIGKEYDPSATHISVVRRFTGGGTVVLGPETCLCSFIMRGWPHDCKNTENNEKDQRRANSSSIGNRHIMIDPKQLMKWSEGIYQPAIHHLVGEQGPNQSFAVRENDYVFGDFKFGGNAQAITKGDWVHHTSFLWGMEPEHMGYLTEPEKQPAYRKHRSHLSFITTLKQHYFEKTGRTEALGDGNNPFWEAIEVTLSSSFEVTEVPYQSVIEDTSELSQSLKSSGFPSFNDWVFHEQQKLNCDDDQKLDKAFMKRRGAKTRALSPEELISKHLPLQK